MITQSANEFTPTKESLTKIFNTLKKIYNIDSISSERKEYLQNLINEYGYLPYSHQQALEEISDAETVFAIEKKLEFNKTFNGQEFVFETLSPVSRLGLTNSEWIKREQHNIKLINLAGLGDGNKTDEPGRFIDWLKQTLTLPAGNPTEKVLSTTAYFIPFHPRDFGCAYIPTDSGVSNALADKNIAEKLNLNAKEQVRLYFALTQLCGHPIMYDVLPQSGRFSKTILANPFVARWFNVKELICQLETKLEEITEELKNNYEEILFNKTKDVINKELKGEYTPIDQDIKEIYAELQKKLDIFKKEYSNLMMHKEKQEEICEKATQLINSKINKAADDKIKEDDIFCQGEIIGELVSKGLWPAPGGAWCSSGVAIFDKMSEGAGYPIFKHYDHCENDVTHFANLDCQTPYYFAYFEKNEYNYKVIDFYTDFLKNLQKEYNFDGFRVDHIDHIVDAYSENKEGFPISYRAPRFVLGKANEELKKTCPHFATLAEYMLWDNFYKEYHQDMSFDILWGNDIVSQFTKNPAQIINDNEYLSRYNSEINENKPKLSIIKTYNNQDGEFNAIDQYPGQLGENGALFKLFKYKFLPGGKLAGRPVMFIDGDESFNKKGIEKAIGFEGSMKRENNLSFFKKFNAINHFALNNSLTINGKAEIIQNEEDGFISWIIKEDNSVETLFVVANRHAETERLRVDGNPEPVTKHYEPVYDKTAKIPEGYALKSEFVYDENKALFIEINLTDEKELSFKKLNPSEFKIYKLLKK